MESDQESVIRATTDTFKELAAKKVKIFIATPCMGGKIEAETVLGFTGFSALCQAFGIERQFSFLTHEALITRARNQLVAEFMASNCTHLFFVDSDHGFDGADILLLASRDESVAAGMYSKKSFNAGLACSYVKGENGELITKGETLVELAHAGTGFLCIKREAIELMVSKYPELKYDNTYSKNFELNNPDIDIEVMKKYTYAFFDTLLIDEKYYGEDNTFCKRWRDIGGRIWGDRLVDVSHVGRYVFDSPLFQRRIGLFK
jgi:hypothetical protein